MMELKHYAALTASAYTRRNVVGKQTSVKEDACRLTTDDDVKALSQIYTLRISIQGGQILLDLLED